MPASGCTHYPVARPVALWSKFLLAVAAVPWLASCDPALRTPLAPRAAVLLAFGGAGCTLHDQAASGAESIALDIRNAGAILCARSGRELKQGEVA